MGVVGTGVKATRVKGPEKGNLGSDQKNEVSETDRGVRRAKAGRRGRFYLGSI